MDPLPLSPPTLSTAMPTARPNGSLTARASHQAKHTLTDLVYCPPSFPVNCFINCLVQHLVQHLLVSLTTRYHQVNCQANHRYVKTPPHVPCLLPSLPSPLSVNRNVNHRANRQAQQLTNLHINHQVLEHLTVSELTARPIAMPNTSRLVYRPSSLPPCQLHAKHLCDIMSDSKYSLAHGLGRVWFEVWPGAPC